MPHTRPYSKYFISRKSFSLCNNTKSVVIIITLLYKRKFKTPNNLCKATQPRAEPGFFSANLMKLMLLTSIPWAWHRAINEFQMNKLILTDHLSFWGVFFSLCPIKMIPVILHGASLVATALGVTWPAPLSSPLQPGQLSLGLLDTLDFALKFAKEGFLLLRKGKIRKWRKRKLDIYSVQVIITFIKY